MAKWQYKVLGVVVWDIGDALKHRDKSMQLDPEIGKDEWMAVSWKRGRNDLARAILSPNDLWTFPEKALNQWGQFGWEIAGVTPALRLAFGGQGQDILDNDYAIWLKKPAD